MPSPPPIGTPASNARAAVGQPTRATPSLPGIRAAAARAASMRNAAIAGQQAPLQFRYQPAPVRGRLA